MNIDTSSVEYTLPGVGCSGIVALSIADFDSNGLGDIDARPDLFGDRREGVGEPLVGSKPLQEHEHQHVHHDQQVRDVRCPDAVGVVVADGKHHLNPPPGVTPASQPAWLMVTAFSMLEAATGCNLGVRAALMTSLVMLHVAALALAIGGSRSSPLAAPAWRRRNTRRRSTKTSSTPSR